VAVGLARAPSLRQNEFGWGIVVPATRLEAEGSDPMKVGFLDAWSRRASRRRQRRFLEAAMSAAALVSMADDEVRLSEQLALDEVFGRIRTLYAFESKLAVDLHREIAEEIAKDPIGGRERAMARVGRFEGNEDDRLSVLYVAAVIARADLELSAAEEVALIQICECLSLSTDEALERIWEVVMTEAARP
jgi:tellurite resistance protein